MIQKNLRTKNMNTSIELSQQGFQRRNGKNAIKLKKGGNSTRIDANTDQSGWQWWKNS